MSKFISKYWRVLQVNLELRETLQNNPFVAFKRSRTLQQIKRDHRIKNGKVFKTHLENRKGRSEPCNTNKRLLYCTEVIDTSTFQKY